jgi:hypothetical protein
MAATFGKCGEGHTFVKHGPPPATEDLFINMKKCDSNKAGVTAALAAVAACLGA